MNFLLLAEIEKKQREVGGKKLFANFIIGLLNVSTFNSRKMGYETKRVNKWIKFSNQFSIAIAAFREEDTDGQRKSGGEEKRGTAVIAVPFGKIQKQNLVNFTFICSKIFC